MKFYEYFLVAILTCLTSSASSVAYVSDPIYGPILNHQTTHMASSDCTTDVNGECEVVVVIPGVPATFSSTWFNGYTAPVNTAGRYLQYGECQVAAGEAGDKVTALQSEDRDGLIPEAARASFPSYPVISRFFDNTAPVASQGWHLWPDKVTSIAAIGFPKFVPSGLYMVAKIKTKTAASGKKVYCNYSLSKHESVK